MPAPTKTVKINLLPKEDFDQTYPGQFLKWALTYGRYIIIITQITVLSVFFLRFKLDRDHVDLKEAISQREALLSSVKDIEDEIRGIQVRLSLIKNLDKNQYYAINILNFLQDISPTDVVYQDIHISGEGTGLTGTGHNLRTLSALLLQLKRSNRFTEITLDDIQRKPDGTVSFKIGTKFLAGTFKS